jgi:hypothetical protein
MNPEIRHIAISYQTHNIRVFMRDSSDIPVIVTKGFKKSITKKALRYQKTPER